MIIDMHVHAFPDKIAERAMSSLEQTYGVKGFSDGTIGSLLSDMTRSGIEISVILNVSTDPKQVISINNWADEINKLGKARPIGSKGFPSLMGFGTIHPQFSDYRAEIQRMKELGIKGVKFQPSFQKFYPDDDKMFPIYEELIKSGIIIFFHAGNEIKPVDMVFSTPRRLARVLDVLEDVIEEHNYRIISDTSWTSKIVAAHLGGYMMWDEVEEFLVKKPIFLDISYSLGHISDEQAMKIINSHGVDRILFGSDSPFGSQRQTLDMISKLPLTKEQLQKIMCENAIKLLFQQ